MRHKLMLPKIAVLLVCASCSALPTSRDRDSAPIPSDPPATAYDFQSVEANVRAAVESGQFPSAAFAIARNGQVIYENALGWGDKEKQVASTAHMPYPLASMSKPIVATALMILHERGRIDLDAPAWRYSGNWFSHFAPESLPRYSVRQLLNHTSGLGTYARIYWRDQNHPVRSLEESFRKYGIVAQPPGAVSEYSNLGYGLLGHIVEQQSGTSLAEFLTTDVFAPLGMKDSKLVDSFSTPAGAAQKYDASGKLLAETYNDTPGAGNIYASAHDLALFGAFHLGGEAGGKPPILSRQSRLLMRSFVDPGARYPYYNSSRYGLGWYFRTNAQGEEVVWHEGGMPGASSIVLLLPRHNIVAAVVINATDANPHAETVANALVQAVEPDYRPVSFDAAEGFNRFTNQPELLGRWEGSIAVDGKDVPWALDFGADGSVRAEFPQRAADSLLPAQATFPMLVNGDLLLATFAATLPASDVAQTPDNYVLLRLLRRGDELSGTAIAYATEQRLEHLYPFAARLRRKTR